MPKARKDKDGDRLHAEGPPPISATDKAKAKEQGEAMRSSPEPKIVVDKAEKDEKVEKTEKSAPPSPAMPKTPDAERKTLDVRNERSSSPAVRAYGCSLFGSLKRIRPRDPAASSAAPRLALRRGKHRLISTRRRR